MSFRDQSRPKAEPDAEHAGANTPAPTSAQATETPSDEAGVRQDGGTRAWLQVLAGHLVNALSWGYAATFGVYQLHYARTTGLPSSQISWIGSIQIFLTFMSCVMSGRLSDAGYTRQTMVLGGFLIVFGTLMTSFATEYWQIVLAQGVCTGLGMGTIYMPALSVISSYFKRKRTLALTIAASGTSTGSLIFPSTVQYLTPRIGFAWAVRCTALEALALAAVAILLLKPHLSPRKGPFMEWSAFIEGSYLLFALGVFLQFYGLYFGFFYINAYARNIIGFSTIESVSLLLITNALGIPARPIAGYIADYYTGSINMFIITVVCVSVVLFGWTGVQDRTGMYVFSAFLGFVNGSCQGMFAGALASLTDDPRKMGTRFGMVLAISGFATLAGPPTAGAIIDRFDGDFFWAQIWGGSVFAVAALALSASRIAVSGWKLRVKA
ncbi:hypothetical protein S7711_08314 [Stachybotrys chartarum IBT 7711]|uniref:Major facilitator superfamily (MFS) profile domain-containing protein n=1 Tax=Stachybotrys chartarum (strain CBS 109288 / IBT 7711) TaxID=1280523 RepID=A0A084AJJ6_STACB|nr:hypothetical protein S7711_08314 [Stachybotrys chartarum IBT 7711]KFA45628.1 hypothetical protein S40293_09119 [Stachybotrys chartarum IBT 40293]